MASTVQVHAQTTRYVKPTATGAGTGATWADASGNLQAMITVSAINDIVWVAAGTYKPTTNPATGAVVANDRNNTFYLKNEVKVYGGFMGTETALSQRNITANPTILNGDFSSNDVVTGTGATLSITNNVENAYHVVLFVSDNANTVLDGFSVKGGNANVSGSITVEGLTIFSAFGGGMFNESSSSSITNCVFSGNNAFSGGGMSNFSSSSSITNCVFSGNNTSGGGGGMSNFTSFPSITNCVFSGNNASDTGGGMDNTSSSSPSITNCVFSGNNATNNGGGISSFTFSSSTIKNTIIFGNTGGGVQGVSTISFSDIQGIAAAGDNISTDPLFVNAANPAGADGIFRTADDGLRIQTTSPCKDTGTNTSAPTLDILGVSIVNITKDMGAYEFVPCPTITNTFSQTNVSCFGGSNGTASVTSPSGGTAPYTYLWSNGATSATITGRVAGTYICTKC